jgi:hypothetical protein
VPHATMSIDAKNAQKNSWVKNTGLHLQYYWFY